MKSYRPLSAILIVFIVSLFTEVSVFGQAASDPAVTAGRSQQDQTMTSMQSSLAQQQAAIDSFRDAAQANSIQQQRQSILKQVQTGEPVAVASTAKQAPGTVEPAQAQKAPGFFTLDWPSAVPLSVPNVQIVDDSCEALPTDQVNQLIGAAAKKQGVDQALLRSVMRQESGFKPCALSVAGAMGLMQIMPDTADMLGLDDPFDPQKNVDAGAKFLKMMLQRYGGDLPMALGAYNAGPGRVDKAGGVPPIAETIQYITNVLGGLPFAYWLDERPER